MNSSPQEFPAQHHAAMLSDQVRLDRFRAAISRQVRGGDHVVEIGTGTGILASYAASCADSHVTAIEYFGGTLAVAQAMVEESGFRNIHLLKGRSYDIALPRSPRVLVTETIGRLGPEERIVEICHDFKRRHPGIETLIPSRLSLYAEPVESSRIRAEETRFLQSYESASHGRFQYAAIKEFLRQSFSKNIRFTDLREASVVGPRTCLATYVLGSTPNPAFSQTIDFLPGRGANGVHLYFEAELGAEVLLSTHRSHPLTHWLHAYIPRMENQNRLLLSYRSGARSLAFEWLKS